MGDLRNKYKEEIKPKLKEEFGIASEMAVPYVSKVVLNVGAGDAKDNASVLDSLSANLAAISGQKPLVTRARKSISNFKLSQGQPIGVMVTLRGGRMYAFLEKLFNGVLPKVRDFRGVSAGAFDMAGNYNLGLREQTLFPEVEFKSGQAQRGLQITIATSTRDVAASKRLLELMGMPFAKEAR